MHFLNFPRIFHFSRLLVFSAGNLKKHRNSEIYTSTSYLIFTLGLEPSSFSLLCKTWRLCGRWCHYFEKAWFGSHHHHLLLPSLKKRSKCLVEWHLFLKKLQEENFFSWKMFVCASFLENVSTKNDIRLNQNVPYLNLANLFT